MTWTPIKRGKPEVRGVHSQYSGLLEVFVPLTPFPPPGWTLDPRPSVIGRRPKEVGGGAMITASDAELEEAIKDLDERIEAANRTYEQDVLPKRKAEEERQRLEAEKLDARLAAARKKLDKL